MCKQAQHVLACFGVLGVSDFGPFADPSAVFGAEKG
jgi:hypothetical protein